MFTIEKGVPYPVGAHRDKSGINFSMISANEDAGVILFDKSGKNIRKKIPFQKEHEIGNVKCFYLDGLTGDVIYAFYEGDTLLRDERGQAFLENFSYGDVRMLEEPVIPAVLKTDDYDWEGDKSPAISYEDSIAYCLHVRGFTKHASSKVKGKGTFLGVTEKIPYLKELGITTLEFQPVYEFNEVEYLKKRESFMQEPVSDPKEEPTRLQYWGYVKGYYYSPKSSYSFSKDAVTEFRNMVKEFHRNGMEVILQFYFTKDILPVEIVQILTFWVLKFHVDGFHLKGKNIDAAMLASDPALTKTKIWYYGFPEECVKSENGRYLAEYREDFRMDMRKFLKGDEDMVSKVMYHLKRNPALVGSMNYISNYDGFTMMDMVSYERKHNEANGEENRDGTDYNLSWNCGLEGVTKKKAIMKLRMQQIRNAFLLLLTAQSTPLFFMGDEFGNSQKGNNNPYCQDNEITWLNWKNAQTNSELLNFVKELIKLRKEHPVFHQEKEVRMMDYGAVGYPDASYHGKFPWKVDTAVYSRQFGIMYCGAYAKKAKHKMDDFFYVAYNMHWEKYHFELPKPPAGCMWEVVMASAELPEDCLTEDETELSGITIPARTICILCAKVNEEGMSKHEDRTAF